MTLNGLPIPVLAPEFGIMKPRSLPSQLLGPGLTVGLALLLGGSGGLVGPAITPAPAQATTARTQIALTRQGTETYGALLRRAEAIARAAAQRAFDSDVLIASVSITVVGQNSGAIAPILRLEVDRQSWRQQPDPQRWSRYFPVSKLLLGFE
mgnify:CR=1 FL=1